MEFIRTRSAECGPDTITQKTAFRYICTRFRVYHSIRLYIKCLNSLLNLNLLSNDLNNQTTHLI